MKYLALRWCRFVKTEIYLYNKTQLCIGIKKYIKTMYNDEDALANSSFDSTVGSSNIKLGILTCHARTARVKQTFLRFKYFYFQ